MVAQMPANTIQAPNLARSAIAPLIRATVMIANVAWKATKAIDGYALSRLAAKASLTWLPSKKDELSKPNHPGTPTKLGLSALANETAYP